MTDLLEALDHQLRAGAPGEFRHRKPTHWDLSVEADDLPSPLRVSFTDSGEVRHVRDTFAGGGLFGQHPVLRNDFEPIAGLYLFERCEDPGTLLDEIRGTVNEWSEGWRNADEYLNAENWPEDLIDARAGLLLEGPLSLVRDCEKVVRRLGIEPAFDPRTRRTSGTRSAHWH